MNKILVTGSAGFIGYHTCKKLLGSGFEVVGIDNINDYYEVTLKEARLARLQDQENFSFVRLDLADRQGMDQLFSAGQFDTVIHLAAQAGVRYSIENPHAYIDSNLIGFINILEGCRHHQVQHLTYASSSSVYGANTTLPFSIHDNVDHPLSLYAATKKANELMAHTYSNLYGLATTGLRFFTVYGPWGRPDMALFLFTDAIFKGRPIDVFNYGQMQRDFTYIDDIVEGVVRIAARPAQPNLLWNGAAPDPGSSFAPWRVYNIGNHSPVKLLHFIRTIEEKIGRKAQLNLLPLQPGDVLATCADVADLMKDVDFQPATPIEVGIHHFIDWYRDYYHC